MNEEGVLAVWVFPRALDLAAMAEIVQDELRPPDLRVRLLSSTGDTITVLPVDGVGIERLDPHAVLRAGERAVRGRPPRTMAG